MTDKNTNIDQALWTEKLGILDTTTYPWQVALLEELMVPPSPGELVKLHAGERLRRQFPWEDHDSATGKVEFLEYRHADDYDDEADEEDDEAADAAADAAADKEWAAIPVTLPLNMRRRILSRILKVKHSGGVQYGVKFPDGSRAVLPMVSDSENLHMLRYFFDKGVFSD